MGKRETAYKALFEHVKAGMPSGQCFERTLRHWNDVAPADMPYVCVAQGRQIPEQVKGLPYRWNLYADIYIYAQAKDDVEACTLLNTMLDELEEAIPLDNLQRQTLGKDFIDQVRVAGEIETDEGLLGTTAVAIVPVLMIVT